jgi:four helix bundle protein
VADALPDTATGKHVGGQLLRCGTSPGANYEEARGAESKRDFVHKLGITLKELQETHYWLHVVARAKLVTDDLTNVLSEVGELCLIIGKSRVTARR